MIRHSIQVGGDILVSSPLPARAHLVRLHPGGAQGYDRMIVVTEEDNGDTLHLAGWVGEPLSLDHWKAARAALFPKASRVRFERLRPDGSLHHVAFPLTVTARRRLK